MERKDRARDKAAGRALAAWMKSKGFTDGKLAKEIGGPTPTVATWRKGTRPMPAARKALAKLTGWNWDNPPDYEASAGQELPDEALTSDITKGVEGVLIARDVIERALKDGTPLNPKDPTHAIALRVASETIEQVVDRAKREDALTRQALEIVRLVRGSPDPKNSKEFLRQHLNAPPEVWTIVDTILDRTGFPGVDVVAHA